MNANDDHDTWKVREGKAGRSMWFLAYVPQQSMEI